MHPTGMNETDTVNYKAFKNYMITHRKPKHFFRIFQSYGISENELEHFPEQITHVLIVYHPKDNKPLKYYLTKIDDWKKSLGYNNQLSNGKPDPQKHIPVRDMDFYDSIEDVPEPEGENE